ncbi:MAG TPA: helix-turn-helix transcriptional regulator [Tepidisphaeraceae bacterium]
MRPMTLVNRWLSHVNMPLTEKSRAGYNMPVDTQKIKSLRERRGWSQEEAAQEAKLKSRQAWNNIESGRRIPRIDTLEKIAAALGVKARDLLK